MLNVLNEREGKETMKKENNIVSLNNVETALKDVLTKKVTISIDTYIDKPAMLLNRVREVSAYIVIENDRLIVHATDRHKTHLVNVKMELIQNVRIITYSDRLFQVIFELMDMGVKYSLSIE